MRSIQIDGRCYKSGQACPVNSAKFRAILSLEMVEGQHGVLTVQMGRKFLRPAIDWLHSILVAKEDAYQAFCCIHAHIEKMGHHDSRKVGGKESV